MNKVFAIIGPPSSGKSTLVKRLLTDFGIPAMVSHTTRAPKAGEIEGVDYYFVDKSRFAQQVFVERVTYSGEYYGLSKFEVLQKLKNHAISVVDISPDGLEQMKKLLGEHLQSIYILVDKDEVLQRCILQGAELEIIQQRLDYADSKGEFTNWQVADYVVKNHGPLDVVLRQILAIMDLTLLCKSNHH